MKKLRVAIQGTGNVGGVVAEELAKAGYKVVAISDSKGGIFNEKGIDVRGVLAEKGKTGKPLTEITNGEKQISNEELLESDVDILIPAALENMITGENANRMKASAVLEMANGPVTPEADAILAANGVDVIPDILANSGGVVGSYFEWVQGLQRFWWEEDEVIKKIEKTIVGAFQAMADEKAKKGGSFRDAAYRLAIGRVVRAMELRGWV